VTAVIQQDPGTRSTRRRAQRRRRVLKRGLLVVLILAVVGGAAALIAKQTTKGSKGGGGLAAGRQKTVLLAMTQHDDPSNQARALTLFGVDPEGTNPVVLFIPTGTLGPIPGLKDFDFVGQALSVGQPSLQQITVANLLGIDIDRTVAIDDVSLGQLIDGLGGITVDVQERLLGPGPGGTQTLQVPLGKHHMDGAEAVTYLTYTSDDSSELDSFVRAQKVWEGIFGAAGSHGQKLVSALAALQPDVSADDATAIAALWKAFAVRSADDRTYEVLPGEAIGGGGDNVSYKPDTDQIAQLVKRDFPGSIPAGVDVAARPDLELRNGNGSPEIGQRAAAILVPAGIHIVVTGNAPNFNFASTRVIVYGDDEQSLALGRKIKSLLGVGTIEVGTRPQSVVDVTVVLGKDFLSRIKGS
jgi:anionic cell wall polymer biosynthesis LytR-Cps2A-Psr (LCP) family protein